LAQLPQSHTRDRGSCHRVERSDRYLFAATIANDVTAWCFGAGRDWRKRIDPIVAATADLD
jgi:hypothetical protein